MGETEAGAGERARSRTGSSLVIAAFDGGEAGRNALAYAAGPAERTGARLIVLHVRSGIGLGYVRSRG